jgi:hypothetical protein
MIYLKVMLIYVLSPHDKVSKHRNFILNNIKKLFIKSQTHKLEK